MVPRQRGAAKIKSQARTARLGRLRGGDRPAGKGQAWPVIRIIVMFHRGRRFRPGVSHERIQFSTARPTTRLNSRSLFVTSVTFSASACAAMSVSSGPIGVPARSSSARTQPYACPARSSNGRIASGVAFPPATDPPPVIVWRQMRLYPILYHLRVESTSFIRSDQPGSLMQRTPSGPGCPGRCGDDPHCNADATTRPSRARRPMTGTSSRSGTRREAGR